MADKKKLNPKQEAFCREYMKDFNGTQAAVRAGYSKKTANRIAYEHLTKPDIQDRLTELGANAVERNRISIDRVVQEYCRIATLDPAELLNEDGSLKKISEMSEDARRSIGGLEIKQVAGAGENGITLSKIKMIDKKGALDSLGKYLGMFIERQEIEHKGEINLFQIKDIRAHKKD